MSVNEIQTLQARLTAVKGKIEFLKHEKARVEKEQKSIQEDLKGMGVSDIGQLQKVIEQKETEAKSYLEKFKTAVATLETNTAEMEKQVSGGV